MKISFFSGLLLSCSVAFAHPDTVRLDKTTCALDLHAFARTVMIPHHHPWSSAVIQLEDMRIPALPGPYFGYVRGDLWTMFTLKNETETVLTFRFEIENPHIDSVLVFFNREPTPRFVTGDWLPFRVRPIHHRNFVFPVVISPKESLRVLLKTNKKGSSTYLPLRLYSEGCYETMDKLRDWGIGFYYGVATIFITLAAAIWLLLRERVYLLYLINTLNFVLYITTNLGLSFQWLYPSGARDLNGMVHFSSSLLLFTTWSFFALEFLQLRNHWPRIRNILLIANYLIIFFLVVGIIFHEPILGTARNFIRFSFFLIIGGGVLLLVCAISLVRKSRPDIIFFLAAYLSIFSTGIVMILRSFGVNIFPLSLNPLLLGSMMEIVTIAVALALQVRLVYRERKQLADQVIAQGKQLLTAYVDGVEKERMRFARELHDDIGSRLGSLQRFITRDHDPSQTLKKQINSLYEDVRKMSHELSPPLLTLLGLQETIARHIAETQLHTEVRFDLHFHELPAAIDSQRAYQIYRVVQEAVQNVVKHSGASECEIQLIGYDNEVVVTIEDNGRGFDLSQMPTGIGLTNMKSRIEGLGGQFSVHSQTGRGASLLVKLPL